MSYPICSNATATAIELSKIKSRSEYKCSCNQLGYDNACTAYTKNLGYEVRYAKGRSLDECIDAAMSSLANRKFLSGNKATESYELKQAKEQKRLADKQAMLDREQRIKTNPKKIIGSKVIPAAVAEAMTANKPNIFNNPPRWDAVKDYAHLQPYFTKMVELWVKTGTRSMRVAFKQHDLLGHILGGAEPNMFEEHLSLVAEVMLRDNLDPYTAVHKALMLTPQTRADAGNLLPFLTLERGHTTIQRMIEFAEGLVGVYKQHPIKELLEAVALF